MTTIVWDGRYLAADRQVTAGGENARYKRTPETKLYLVHDHRFLGIGPGSTNGVSVVAGAGNQYDVVCFRHWLENGGDYPILGEDTVILVLDPTGKMERFYDTTKKVAMTTTAPHTLGAEGAAFAFGALDMGANAMKAVEIASKRCLFTGDGIDFVDVQEFPRRIWSYPDCHPSDGYESLMEIPNNVL